MGYLDKQCIFADNLDVKATRQVSTTYDQLVAGRSVEGGELTLVINVTAAFTRAAGAIDSVFSLQTHTADDFSADRTVLWSSASIAKASLVAGYNVIKIKLPAGLLRYINVVTVNTNAADAANIDAFLVPNAEYR